MKIIFVKAFSSFQCFNCSERSYFYSLLTKLLTEKIVKIIHIILIMKHRVLIFKSDV